MDFDDLTHFAVLAEELNFRRATQRLDVRQPTLTRRIRRLEQELGVYLLERHTRRINLTGAGEILAERSHHLIDEQAKLTSETDAGSARICPHIGCSNQSVRKDPTPSGSRPARRLDRFGARDWGNARRRPQCGGLVDRGLAHPWPDPAHREAVAVASGQVEGKTMATLGSFAKVPWWHWWSRASPSGQCQDAHRHHICEDGQWLWAFGHQPGRDWRRLEEDPARCGRSLALLEWPNRSLVIRLSHPDRGQHGVQPYLVAPQRQLSHRHPQTPRPPAGRWNNIAVRSSSEIAPVAFVLLHAGVMPLKFIS